MARSCTRPAWQAAAVFAAVSLVMACPTPRPPADKAWSLTTTVVGSGSVSRSSDLAAYPDGTRVTLTAVPDGDWAFLGWSGSAAGRGNPLSIEMTSNVSVTATFYELVSRDASAASCVLGGNPCDGEQWTVTLGGVDATITVAGGQALADVAAALASHLDGREGYLAGSEGTAFGVVDAAGEPIDLAIAVEAAGWATLDNADEGTAVVTLTGAPLAGETWTLDVNGLAASRTVASGETLAEVASGLASQLDSRAEYRSSSHDGVLAICRIAGGALVVSPSLPAGCSANVDYDTPTTRRVVLAGAVNAGDAWNIVLGGSPATRTAAAGDTLAIIAAALASSLAAVPDFMVGSDGAVAAFVKEAGGSFALAAGVAATGHGTVDTVTPTVLLLAPGGDVSAGDTWTLRLDGIDYPYAAQEGDTAASLAAALAALADGADGIVASSESAAIAVESLGGGSLEASLAVSPP